MITVKTYTPALREISDSHPIRANETESQAIERIIKAYSQDMINGFCRIAFYLTVNGVAINWRGVRPDLSAELDRAMNN